jgi:histidinol-phosphate aminotransferase
VAVVSAGYFGHALADAGLAQCGRVPAWRLPATVAVAHGGPGRGGPAPHDFSSNGNAAGPLPSVLQAVVAADRRRYPDPSYHALRAHLAAWHGVDPDQVVVCASASAFIAQFTAAVQAWRGVRRVHAPMPGYGDYAAAAQRCGLPLAEAGAPVDGHSLVWCTEPANPGGHSAGAAWPGQLAAWQQAGAVVVLDLAYHPLRLDGRHRLADFPAPAARCWQLWSPNKAAGLTGVRAAYAIAPPDQAAVATTLQAGAPSWPVGAEGVALLRAFTTDTAQAELAVARATLARWMADLAALLRGAGWALPGPASVTPFLLARSPARWCPRAAAAAGVQLRDTTSQGLPGHWRLSAQPPASLAALAAVLAPVGAAHPTTPTPTDTDTDTDTDPR